MKFGQLIEYNMRNIFLEKSFKKCGGETSRKPPCKKSKSSSWDTINFEILSFLKLSLISYMSKRKKLYLSQERI